MVAFNPPRDRDAWASIRGFVYQVDLTISRWLGLAPDEVLELERGEDIDLVSASIQAGGEERDRLLEQVKHRDRPVTLNSQPAVAAVACAFEHRRANPELSLRFRFTTNAIAGKERFSRHPRPCIEAWEDMRTGRMREGEIPAALSAVRSLLKSASRPASLNAETWRVFNDAVEHGTDEELLAFVRSFEWGTRAEDAAGLSDSLVKALVDSGRARDSIQARSLYERLFLHVFKTISQDGIKRLSPQELDGLVAMRPLSASDGALLENVVVRLLAIEGRLDQAEEDRRRQGLMLGRLDEKVQALAREQRVLTSVEYPAEDLDLEMPLPCRHLSSRRRDVARILHSLENHAWTAIHGGASTGKTELAGLVARSRGISPIWIRMRDLGPKQAARRLDLAIDMASGVSTRSGRSPLYREAAARLGRAACIILDDLPRLNAGGSLCERLLRLALALQAEGGRLLTASSFAPPPGVSSRTPVGLLNAVPMPEFSGDDTHSLLRSLGAPESLLEAGIVGRLEEVAGRHPLLVDAVGRHLAQKSWRFRDEEWRELLAGEHAGEVTRETIGRLLRTVEDHRSRELLYRLTLVMGDFSEDDAASLGSVDPSLDRPRERLDAVIGPWVQEGARGSFRLSPLVEAVGSSDLPRKVRRRCLLRLGSRVLRSGPIGPEGLVRAVSYYNKAGAVDRAGLLLIQALSHLNSLDHDVDPREVLSLWYGVELPVKMSLGHRLYLRALQYRVRARYRRPVEGLLADVDRLSRLATVADGWGVFGAAVLLGRHLGPPDRILGVRLLRRAFQLTDRFGMPTDRELELPDGLGPEWMIWSVAGDLDDDEAVSEWKAAVEALGPESRMRAFSHETAEAGCSLVAGSLHRAELKVPEGERRWDRVLEHAEDLASWAKNLGLELLWAAAVRYRAIILGEDQRRTDDAIAVASEALRAASADPRVHFLLSDTPGEFLLREGRAREALEWLERALDTKVGGFILERLLTLVNASRATATTDPGRSLEFLREAGRLAREDATLPDIEVARVLGEVAIGEGLAGNLVECFRHLQEGVERLLGCKEETSRWRILFVLSGHASGYFTSLAFRGSPPESTRSGEEYAEPRRGGLYGYTQEIDQYYEESNVYAVALQMAIFADAVGDDARAAVWVARALDLARGNGQSAIVEEITRRFAPQLVLDGRYSDAMEAALEYGASLVARSIEQQAGRSSLSIDTDVSAILGERPNDNWRRAEHWGALQGLLPIAVQLCRLAIEDKDAARASAGEVVAICRQIGAGSADPELWASLAELIDAALVAPIGGGPYRERVKSHSTSTANCRELIARLLLSVQPEVTAEEALALQLSIMPALEQYLDRPLGGYRRILVPFYSSYWVAMFGRMRFRFKHPALVELELSAAISAPAERRIRAVTRAIMGGIPVRLPPETRAWLNED